MKKPDECPIPKCGGEMGFHRRIWDDREDRYRSTWVCRRCLAPIYFDIEVHEDELKG